VKAQNVEALHHPSSPAAPPTENQQTETKLTETEKDVAQW
jgi:hypothetical protein